MIRKWIYGVSLLPIVVTEEKRKKFHTHSVTLKYNISNYFSVCEFRIDVWILKAMLKVESSILLMMT
jgi:hypothetical protein